MARPRRLQPHPDNPECPAPFHGTDNAYEHARPACRCPDAREDHRLRRKRCREGRTRHRLVPSLGPVRMVRGLAALGHSSAAIAAAGGMSERTARGLRQGRSARTTPGNAAAAARAFTALRHVPGTSPKTRTIACRLGWPRADEWLPDEIDDPTADPRRGETVDVDQVKVSECAAGRMQLALLNRREQELAALQAIRVRGPEALGDWLGTSSRQVDRVRARVRDREAAAAERQPRAS